MGRRLAERVSDHSGRYKSSHMHEHSIEKEHRTVKLQDFEIISKGFRRNNSKGRFQRHFSLKKNNPL